MDDIYKSLGYICICIDDIPPDFEPLGSKDIFFNSSAMGIKDIFIYLANLYKNKECLNKLSNVISEWDKYIEPIEASIEWLEKSLEAIIDKRFKKVVLSYIFADRKNGEEDIFGSIMVACLMANNLASLLCEPEQVRNSGMENRDVVTAMIGSCDDVGIAFQTRYRPIMGYCKDTFTYVDTLIFDDLISIVNMAALSILKNGVIVRECHNCGDFFIPVSRSDEIYCSKLLANGKTCKTVGYDERVKNDNILREYRRIYKTQNARKQRNQHRNNISGKFRVWSAFAKEKVSECQAGKISIEEMVSAISSDKWMK